MALYPQTGSILDNNGNDDTRTGLSTSIVIKVNGTPVGAIQNLQITEDRTITMVNEVGTDGSIDSAPTASSTFSGTCERIRFDEYRVANAFTRGFIHVHSQRIPFDIDIFDSWVGDGSNMITSTLRNVWIKSISYAYRADNWIIVDNMAWVAETMYSKLGANNPVAQPGTRGIPLQINNIEQQSDIGLRRGSLDSPGLLTDFFNV